MHEVECIASERKNFSTQEPPTNDWEQYHILVTAQHGKVSYTFAAIEHRASKFGSFWQAVLALARHAWRRIHCFRKGKTFQRSNQSQTNENNIKFLWQFNPGVFLHICLLNPNMSLGFLIIELLFCLYHVISSSKTAMILQWHRADVQDKARIWTWIVMHYSIEHQWLKNVP